ncbi:non-ribosomal peptide synthetase [Amycolatopsis sp. PS_44_ISF1]|uniref:non-ribosomal peptide synthetase n=1 Tax=Amycolatopsis sp. PS_44_ISF1 TaxID=2974917 RepID=UPI0028DE3D26|nr:non-ribosomal peptide synthetase [Amycolatopsis sp. PS_44_ISF1]MDT8912926.1 amino acid adenylation domain-containing protein [Amycolatopsis sp. PS_44_ISF1]
MTTTESRRQELLDRLLSGANPAPKQAEIPTVPRNHTLPLSSSQRQLWFLDQLRPGATEYVMPFAWRLSGPLDVSALRRALTEITARHEILRTRYTTEAGEPAQVVLPPAPVDLRDAVSVDPKSFDTIVRDLTTTPFDLAADAPVRWTLLATGPHEHVLLLVIHHIAFDGQSAAVLARELGALCTAPGSLPAPAVQYADFAAWQRDQAHGLDYWRDRLAGLTPLDLPTDRPRPPVLDPRGATTRFTIPAPVAGRVRELARAHRATPFMVLLAAFQVLLSRYSGQTDIAVGTPVAGRARPETHEVLGCFVNTVVLRADLTDDPSFPELLAQVRETTLAALAHQDTPFDRIVDDLAVDRDPSRNPLISAMFVLQNTDRADFTSGALTGTAVPVDWHSAKFDLTLYLTEQPDGSIAGVVEYATALFDRATAERAGGHYLRLLSDTARLELLTEQENQQLVGWNGTVVSFPGGVLPEVVGQQAARTPERVAVRFGGAGLTYAELDRRANRLAHHLIGLGVGPEDIVGVSLERSLELVVALVGIHKAGAAYLPIDPGHPRDRIQYLLTDSGARTIVTAETFTTLDGPVTDPGVTVLPGHPAYVIYTSGSTGRPKGVVIDHRAIMNRLRWMQAEYGLDGTDRVLQKTPYTFDVSVWEFFWPLITGATLVLAAPGGHRDPAYLADLMTHEDITTVHFVPSMLRAFLTEPVDHFPSLRRMICSGEALTADLVTAVHERLHCPLHNLYGPTEAAVDVTATECHPGHPVTIGRPIANTRTYILDPDLRPVPIGVPGELMLAGIQLARGYLNQPALTAQQFIPNPHHTPGDRLYRTGDLARYRHDGTIDYLGRLDHQIKIRGQRIEPGEIETVLTQHPDITTAAITIHNGQLAAYITPAHLNPDTLRHYLHTHLPDTMIPTHWTTLHTLPLTTNGKINRTALPTPGAHRPATGSVAPRTPVEQRIARAMAEAIGTTEVGVHERFFRIGGDSMRAIRVVGRLRQDGLDISVQDVFRHQTVAGLAAAVTPRTTADHRPAPFELIDAADRDELPGDVVDAYPLSMVQAGMVYEMQTGRGRYLNRLSYPIHDDAPLSVPALVAAAQLLARRHEILRTSIDLDAYSRPLQLVHAEAEIRFGPATPELHTPSLLALHAEPLDGHGWQLSIVYCHPILDGWSQNSLVPELLGYYRAIRDGGEPTPEPPPAVRFADSVALEQASLASGADRDFWASRVAGEPLAIPQTWAPAKPEWRAVRVDTADLTPGLRAVATEADVPLKSVLLAAHLTVLSLVSGRRRFHTGLVCNGRPELDGGDQVRGMFLNTVPFGVDLEQPTWAALARVVFAEEVALWPHRHFPLPAMQREWGGGAPLVDVFFNHTDMHVLAGESIGLDGIEDTTPNEFGLSVSTEPGVLVLESERIDAKRLDLLAAAYRHVLASVGAGSDPRACRLPEAERSALLERWNDHAAPLPERTVPELFADHVARNPAAPAVVSDAGSLTYAELDARTNQVARHLRGLGVGPGTRVGVRLDRGPDLVVAFLAVLKAGGAYVPLDPAYPARRVEFMLADAGATVILDQALLAAATGPADPVPVTWTLDDLAYVIYTSGSTGTPKGVLIHHRGLANHLAAMAARPGLAAGQAIMGLTTISFDPSVIELFLPLVTGAHVVLADDEQARDPHRMTALIDAAGPQVLQATPVTLRMLLDSGWVPRAGLKVLSGGEKLPGSLARRLAEGGATVWDLYGPTETTVWATMARLDATGAVAEWTADLNSVVHLLGERLEPVPLGVVGEVCLGGTGLAWGYRNRPESTAAAFVPNPFGGGDRLYRTGDLARRRPDGSLEILGRADDQVKIRGHRIEPGEIEAALLAHEAVRAAVVQVVADQLVAYVVPEAPAGLHDRLLRVLPDYMVPSAFVSMAEFPLTPTGKVDRKALPAPDASSEVTAEGPRTPVEEAVAAAWCEVLGRERVGVHDNFFRLGGHSLLATRVAVRLRATQGVDVPVRALFDHGTVAGLAAALPGYPKTAESGVPALSARRRGSAR